MDHILSLDCNVQSSPRTANKAAIKPKNKKRI